MRDTGAERCGEYSQRRHQSKSNEADVSKHIRRQSRVAPSQVDKSQCAGHADNEPEQRCGSNRAVDCLAEHRQNRDRNGSTANPEHARQRPYSDRNRRDCDTFRYLSRNCLVAREENELHGNGKCEHCKYARQDTPVHGGGNVSPEQRSNQHHSRPAHWDLSTWEVATAMCILMAMSTPKNASATSMTGTMMTPPPIPNSPASTPATPPASSIASASSRISFIRVAVAA